MVPRNTKTASLLLPFLVVLASPALQASQPPSDPCEDGSPGVFGGVRDLWNDQPVNVRLWVDSNHYLGREAWLEGPNGERRDLQVSEVEVPDPHANGTLGIAVLRPTEPLPPDTMWSFHLGESVGWPEVRIRTEPQPDLEPPGVPEVDEQESSLEAQPGSIASRYSASIDLRRTDPDLLYVAVFEDEVADFDTDGPGGWAAALSSGDTLLFAHEANCGNWDLEPGDSTDVLVGAYDLAGNFSGWSAPVTLSLPDQGCGCSDAGGGPVTLALLPLPIAAIRRRRRALADG